PISKPRRGSLFAQVKSSAFFFVPVLQSLEEAAIGISFCPLLESPLKGNPLGATPHSRGIKGVWPPSALPPQRSWLYDHRIWNFPLIFLGQFGEDCGRFRALRYGAFLLEKRKNSTLLAFTFLVALTFLLRKLKRPFSRCCVCLRRPA